MSGAAVTLIILALVVIAFISGKIPAGLVALGAALALLATGVIDLQQSFAGFADPAVVLIASLFVVAEGLDAAIPLAGVLALLIAGTFATTIGWRWSFALMVALAVVNFLISFRLKAIPPQRALRIDWPGAIIAAVSIILLSFGFSGLNSWGVVLASPDAPFSILGVSPAPLLILLGLIGGQVFFVWLRRKTPKRPHRIFDLRVLATGSERAITACMAIMLFVGTAANFLIPLYIQVVQGRSSIETSFSIIPYTISIFVASTFVAVLYKRFPPKQLAIGGFIVVAAGLTLLAFTIRGDWEQVFVVIGLIVLGLGQGSIVALVFNTLLSTAPKELAGDVGAWRGLVHNLSGSVGIAVATAFAVGILASTVTTAAEEHPKIPSSLIEQVDLNSVQFVTNDHLKDVMGKTDATPAQIDAAVAINESARLRSLSISLLGLAGLALLAIVPATRMPGRRDEDLPEVLSANLDDDAVSADPA